MKRASAGLRWSRVAMGVALGCAVGAVGVTHSALDQRGGDQRVEGLRFLPSGDYLKPVLLGYHHVVADVLWLRMIQVIGERTVSAKDYEWLSRGLDVVTTLDPHYDYAYQVGGVVLAELADRADLSNRLLEKGLAANPTVWQIPFYLGYNHFFYLHEYARAAEYMAQASRVPGRPDYLPPLAARLYAQAGSPETALEFLDMMWRQTENQAVRASLEWRMKEVTIERDIRILEEAVARFRQRTGRSPTTVTELTQNGLVPAIPPEPFGGVYRLHPETGAVTSSTHPERLRVYRSRP